MRRSGTRARWPSFRSSSRSPQAPRRSWPGCVDWRSLMERYLDDFKMGERFRSKGVTLTQSEIINFALAYDPQPFHIDVEAAAHSPFGGLVASGLHTLALGWRMFLQEGL